MAAMERFQHGITDDSLLDCDVPRLTMVPSQVYIFAIDGFSAEALQDVGVGLQEVYEILKNEYAVSVHVLFFQHMVLVSCCNMFFRSMQNVVIDIQHSSDILTESSALPDGSR